MSRLYVTGVNDEALTAVGTDVREIITGLDPDGDGRIFELAWLEVSNEHASALGVLELYDSDESTAVVAATQRAVFQVPPGETLHIDFPDGRGPKFGTNMVAGISAGTVATLGGIRAGGYLV